MRFVIWNLNHILWNNKRQTALFQVNSENSSTTTITQNLQLLTVGVNNLLHDWQAKASSSFCKRDKILSRLFVENPCQYQKIKGRYHKAIVTEISSAPPKPNQKAARTIGRK